MVAIDASTSGAQLLAAAAILLAAGYSAGPLIVKHRLVDLDARRP